MINLYGKGSSGKIQSWSIDNVGNEIKIEYGEINGKKQIKTEEVICGLGGRTVMEQVALNMASRIKNKIDGGYTYNLKEAEQSVRTNALGFLRPMLASKYSDKTKFAESFFIQRKYNGHRCLITNLNGATIAYSRKGNIINTINHILKGINIKEGETIDGELYIHGVRFQDITSSIKKKNRNTKLLQFICYDYISTRPYWFRYLKIKNMNWSNTASVAHTLTNVMEKDIAELMNEFINDGYEGLIIRKGDYGYEDGKRSKGLLKVKRFHDAEFKVVNITASKDGVAILHFVSNTGKPFKATAPGTVKEKIHIYDHSELYMGRMVTLEYAELTKEGIPFQPIAKCFLQEI